MVQLKKEEAYYDESIEMPTKGDCLFNNCGDSHFICLGYIFSCSLILK